MAKKELRIPHDQISDSQTITKRNEEIFKEHGMSIHTHEVDGLEDDHKKGVRILKVRNVKYFDLGRRSGHQLGRKMERS